MYVCMSVYMFVCLNVFLFVCHVTEAFTWHGDTCLSRRIGGINRGKLHVKLD